MAKTASAGRLDQIFHALSDPTRREILMTVVRRPRTVTELARPYPTSLNAISKHLKVLEGARLIRRKRVGTRHHISAEENGLAPLDQWMATYRKGWASALDSLGRFLEQRP